MSAVLVEPTADLYSSWLQAREEFGPGAHIDGSGLMEHDDVETPAGFAAWTERLRRCADPSVAPAPGRVHSTYRWVVETNDYLGTIDLRHELNDFLLEAGGHIGYSIRPSARRRGLATWALARTLERARPWAVKPAGVVYVVVRVMLVVGQAVRACRGSVITS